MDTTKTITHLGLCAGYGGIELGLKRVLPTLRTVALCEIEAFACANLVAKMEAGLMDAAPIWTDLKTFPWAEFCDRVDILTGGYPCQPFSSAGKRFGADDPRHLWPYIADGIRLLRPRVCFFENVEGHISLGLREVIADLESLGYQATWGIFSASECLDASGRTAPHQRKRVFILAHRDSERGQLSDWRQQSTEQMPIGNGTAWRDVWPSRPGEPQHAWEPPRVVVADTYKHGNGTSLGREARQGSGELHNESTSVEPPRVVEHSNGDRRKCNVAGDAAQQDSNRQDNGVSGEANSMGDAQNERCRRLDDESSETSGWQARGHADRASTSEQQGQWQTQPSMGRDINGPASGLDYAELCVSCDNRTDELRLLGNGVVPATAERAFRTLLAQI